MRRGIVFIAWIGNDDEPGYYSGYWDGGGRGPHEGLLGQMPETSSVETALEWAQARARVVRIRPSWDPSHYYSAGVDPTRGLPPLGLPDSEL